MVIVVCPGSHTPHQDNTWYKYNSTGTHGGMGHKDTEGIQGTGRGKVEKASAAA